MSDTSTNKEPSDPPEEPVNNETEGSESPQADQTQSVPEPEPEPILQSNELDQQSLPPTVVESASPLQEEQSLPKVVEDLPPASRQESESELPAKESPSVLPAGQQSAAVLDEVPVLATESESKTVVSDVPSSPEKQSKVIISEQITKFSAPPSSVPSVAGIDGGSMLYDNQKWALDNVPQYVVREWKAQSWASSAASSGTAMETFTKSLQFSTDGSMAYENQDWELEKEPNRLAENGGSVVPVTQNVDPSIQPTSDDSKSTDGSMAYENQPWVLEKDATSSDGAGLSNGIIDLGSGGSMAYENQPWVLEKDPSHSGGNKGPPSDLTVAPGGSMAYENQAWALEKDPNRIGTNGPSMAYFQLSFQDGGKNPVQTQTDTDGNAFENVEVPTNCKTENKPCGGVANECFPNQTECNDLELGQLVGVAQDFFYEAKQLGWYFISQCLEWLNDDKCDPCVCRDANQNQVSVGKSTMNLTDGSETQKDMHPSADGSMAYENQPWVLEKDPTLNGGSGASGGSALALTSDGPMAYENQPWVLDKDPSKLGGNGGSESVSTEKAQSQQIIINKPSSTGLTEPSEPLSIVSLGPSVSQVEGNMTTDSVPPPPPSDIASETQSWTLEKNSSETGGKDLELATEAVENETEIPPSAVPSLINDTPPE